jgi:hypothetical protein
MLDTYLDFHSNCKSTYTVVRGVNIRINGKI